MKTILVLLFSLYVSYATVGTGVWMAGDTTGSATTGPYPSVSAGACTTGASSSPYVALTATITATNWYWVTALFEESSQTGYTDMAFSATLAIYPGSGANQFTSTAPCTNVIKVVNAISGGAPHVYFPVMLAAGTYTVVVTTTVASEVGKFAWHIDPVDWYNATSNAGPYWTYPLTGTVGQCSTSGGFPYSYSYYRWTQATTGWYDVNVLFQNTSAAAGDYNPFIRIALFNGTQSWLGNGTYAAPVDPCAGTNGAGFMIANYEYSYQLSTYQGTSRSQAYHQYLVAGTTYTLIASSDDSSYTNGWFSARIVPTQYFFGGTTANFNYPLTDTSPCAVSTYTNNWGSNSFTAAYTTYVISTGYPDDLYLSNYMLAYPTLYAIPKVANPPTPCPTTGFIQSVDSAESIAYGSFTVGTNYTVVVANDYGGTENIYPLFIMGGSTGSGSTSGPTGTPTGSSHSDASTAVINSFVVLAVVIIAAFF